MRLNALISSASLLVAMTTASISANASPDTDKAAEIKAATTAAQIEKAPIAERHSHMQERTGAPQKAPESVAARPNAAKDTSRHFHPRDGK